MTQLAVIVDPFSSGARYSRRFRDYGVPSIAVISNEDLHESYLRSFDEGEFESVYRWKIDPAENAKFLKSIRPSFVVAGSEPGVELADFLLLASLESVSGKPVQKSAGRGGKAKPNCVQ